MDQVQNRSMSSKHTSRLWLLIILIVVAVLLALIVGFTDRRQEQMPSVDTTAQTAPANDDSASIQAELDSLDFDGVSEGI